MQRLDRLYHVIEGDKNKMDNLSQRGTYFSENQCASPEFKKHYTKHALNIHQTCGGGIFHIDRNVGIFRNDFMAVVLEYKISEENVNKIENCIQNSFKSGTVKTQMSFAYQPSIISIETLFSPDNFLGYYVKIANREEMKFFLARI